MLVLLVAFAALFGLSLSQDAVQTCQAIYSSAVSASPATSCQEMHILSICIANALDANPVLTSEGNLVLGDALAANSNCNLTAIPFTTYIKEDNGQFVFQGDATKTLTVTRYQRTPIDYQNLGARTAAVEAANANAGSSIGITASTNISVSQQQTMRDIATQIAATAFADVNARVAFAESVLPGFTRSLTYDMPALVSSLRGDISQRIANEASLRASVSGSVSSLLGLVSTSIVSSFSNTMAAHNSLRATFSSNRVWVYQSGSNAVSSAINWEVSRLAYEANLIPTQNALISTTASRAMYANLSAEAPRADAMCAQILVTKVGLILPQLSTNDGNPCTSAQAGRPYFSTPRQKFFICNGSSSYYYWNAIVHGGFQESTILTSSAYIAPIVAAVGYRWTLCYRGSAEFWSNWAFKDNCGHLGPTFIVGRYGSRIFGGYTEVSWDNHQIYVPTYKGFLWRFDPATGWFNQAFSTGTQYGILQYHPFTSNNGPYFGQGDFYISGQTAYFNNNNFFVVTNGSQASFSNTWMSGTTSVTLTEMEAYIKI